MSEYSTAEVELADRARGGDLRALEELHQRYHQRLYHHAFRMLQEQSAAQDVVQEAFTRAITEIHRTRPALKFKAWIYRITTNLCLRQLNTRRRWTDELKAVEGNQPSPEQIQLRAEIAVHLTRALAELPPRYRQVLLLRELEDLSYKEVAEVLQLKESRLKVLLHRARLRLAAVLIADQLMRDTTVTVQCAGLKGLIQRTVPKRRMVKHIEQCQSCREREGRPAAELFAFLPPIGMIPAGVARFPAADIRPTLPPGKSGGFGSGGFGSGGFGSGGFGSHWFRSPRGWVTAGAAVSGAFLVFLISMQHASHKNQSQSPERSVKITPLAQTPASAQIFAGGQPRAEPLAVAGESEQKPRSSQLALFIPPGLPSRSELPYRPLPQDVADPRGLAIEVLHPPEQLIVRREQRFIPFKHSDQVQLNDVISSRVATPFAIRFPGGQWLVCRGQLQLKMAPLHGQAPHRIQLALLSGELRAGATIKGKGFEVYLGGVSGGEVSGGEVSGGEVSGGEVSGGEVLGAANSRMTPTRSYLRVESGEFRARITPHALEVEALDGYVQVEGLHAPRILTPGSGLTIAGRVGFPRQLFPAALDLRPVSGCVMHRSRLSWSEVPNAKRYQVVLGADPHFLTGQRIFVTTTTAIQLGHLASGKYFWMIQAVDKAGHPGQPSKIYSFTIGGDCS